MAWRPERLVPAQTDLGECPVWDAPRRTLYWMDITAKELHTFGWDTAKWRRHSLPALGGGLVLCRDGGLIAGLQTGIHRIDPASFAATLIVDPEPDKPDNRLNEMKCDPHGRVWVGSMSTLGRVPSGALWRLDRDGLHRVLDGIVIPNAMTWLRDGEHFLFADSFAKTIWQFRYDPATAAIFDRRVFADCTGDAGMPDGCALDAEGCLWVAEFGGGQVKRYDPRGLVIDVITLPATQVTSCAFAGDDLDLLVIVTTKRLLDEAGRQAQPDAGDLFVVRAPVPGVPVHRCAL